MKKLTRSKDDQMLAGVCAGIADYFDIDPTIVRILWVLFALTGGGGVIAYIIAVLVIPLESEVDEDEKEID